MAKHQSLIERLRELKYRAALAMKNHREDPEGHGKILFSQEGEDALLGEVFASTQKGFYVDVGALHPIRYSNTYSFYLRGWNGINMDATPGSMEPFRKFRPRDINLECAISDRTDDLEFFVLNEPSMNTFDRSLVDKYTKDLGYKVVETKRVRTRPLADVLEEHLPKNQSIDFMDVDVEGFDLQVLTSNNWEAYRPKILLVENFTGDFAEFLKSDINRYLEQQKYRLRCRGLRTCMFQSDESSESFFKTDPTKRGGQDNGAETK
jgi:FkbM family methyltransferase